jgi:hypothetical protein
VKELALSDSFWHINEVFVAVEETAETSLRILDSDRPNLKDAAFAFMRIAEELKWIRCSADLLGSRNGARSTCS